MDSIPKSEGALLAQSILLEAGQGWSEILRVENPNGTFRLGWEVLKRFFFSCHFFIIFIFSNKVLADVSCGLLPPSEMLVVLVPWIASSNDVSRTICLQNV